MRIISGSLKGRRFDPPAKNWPTRPTTDYAKEGLFNMLDNILEYETLRALDLFGGTGNHSFELISRGTREVVYVDSHFPCVQYVRKLANHWQVSDYVKIVKSDARKFLMYPCDPFDYIFAGPPYSLKWLDEIPGLIRESNKLTPGGLFVLEHNPHHDFSKSHGFSRSRNYGQTIFSFFDFE